MGKGAKNVSAMHILKFETGLELGRAHFWAQSTVNISLIKPELKFIKSSFEILPIFFLLDAVK